MLRIVLAEGAAADRGRTIGREIGDLIGRSLAFYRELFARRGIDAAALARLVAPYRAAAAALPEQAALLHAIAEAADVSADELWAVNAVEELERFLEPAAPAVERCSTFTALAPGATILAHNEMWYAGDAGNVAVVVEVGPGGTVRHASPTVAACLSAVGMNGAGLGQGIVSLSARDDRVGIPRVLVSRHALEAVSAEDARRRATLPGRAGGYAHVFALRGGDAFVVETTATASAVLTGPGSHTNHYLDPGLAQSAAAASEGSLARRERLAELLRERPPATPEDAMELLRDHASSPQAICEHPDSADGDEASAVLFSMVCELEGGRMWVAPGNPCDTPYEEVDVTDVV